MHGPWQHSAFTTVATLLTLCTAICRAEEPPMNVLFIAVDDLRPELGCYGAAHIHSPNIDALAASGRRFERAYCQQALCNPSRTSLMTGMRPDSTGVVGNWSHFRTNHPDIVTLPQYLKSHGYHAAAIGKIYHGLFPSGASRTKWDTMGDPASWSVPAIRFGPRYYYTEEGIATAKRVYQQAYRPTGTGPDDWTKKLVFGLATEAPEVSDDVLYDGQVADSAVKALRQLQQSEEPFFLAVGFIKPHSPYIAPSKYFERYEDIALPTFTELPTDAPDFAGHRSGELRRYADQPNSGAIPSANQRRVRQAYYACISYIDAQIGRVLDELERTGLHENTVVILFGDHGYHLGEHGLWGKTTNYELDTRVPLIVRVPGMEDAGESSTSLVELIDLYPTVAELTGLPITEQLEGKSLVPILDDPAQVTKTVALSQYPRSDGVMGYSLRTPTHRLTQWVHRKSGEVRAVELYDYSESDIETKNIAITSPEVVERLANQLSSVAGLNETDADKPATDNAPRSANATAPARPNIVLIVSEDNGAHLGCYGETRVHTPHLDALAARGVRYTRAYVPYSVCSPSRAAFLTGLYPRQTGHIGLATHRFSMYRDFKTLPAYFQQAGYFTGFLGKTHINPAALVEDFVDHRAIQEFNFDKTIGIETYAEEAGKVMRSAARRNQQFFLVINYADAHRRFVGTTSHGFPTRQVTDPIEPFPWIGSDAPHLRSELRDYFNCINRLDEGIGMVLEQLQVTGNGDSTLVVYISDHGADFPRGKGSIYENGTRIPMIVNYPRSFSSGKVEQGMVSTIDILPTLLRAVDLPIPTHLPGLALQDVDSGSRPARNHIHTFTTGAAPNLLYVQFGIRDQHYKLVYNPDRATNRMAQSRYRNSRVPEDQQVASFLRPPEYELFDLHEDPHEWVNLADSEEHQPIKQRLLRAMQDFQREINDPFASRANTATFIAEQKEYLNKPYKQAGFRWPHLDLFEKAHEFE